MSSTWFDSAIVKLPAAALGTAGSINVPFHSLDKNAPPKDCGDSDADVTCTADGGWAGTLTLKAER